MKGTQIERTHRGRWIEGNKLPLGSYTYLCPCKLKESYIAILNPTVESGTSSKVPIALHEKDIDIPSISYHILESFHWPVRVTVAYTMAYVYTV